MNEAKPQVDGCSVRLTFYESAVELLRIATRTTTNFLHFTCKSQNTNQAQMRKLRSGIVLPREMKHRGRLLMFRHVNDLPVDPLKRRGGTPCLRIMNMATNLDSVCWMGHQWVSLH